MTPEFKPTAEEAVTKWRDSGMPAPDAARALEVYCGKNNQEYAGFGPQMIEQVYDGKLSQAVGGAGLRFVANPKAEVAPPIAEEEPSATTNTTVDLIAEVSEPVTVPEE